VEKNLLSTADGATALKFFNQATQAFEFDSSQTFNEPGNYALRSAIETAVIELINKGERNGLWKFKEKSNELVQTQAPAKDAAKATSTPSQPDSRKDNGAEKTPISGAVDANGNPIRSGN
jgi:curli biogenesis system outer membrane secretion channel CsgG